MAPFDLVDVDQGPTSDPRIGRIFELGVHHGTEDVVGRQQVGVKCGRLPAVAQRQREAELRGEAGKRRVDRRDCGVSVACAVKVRGTKRVATATTSVRATAVPMTRPRYRSSTFARASRDTSPSLASVAGRGVVDGDWALTDLPWRSRDVVPTCLKIAGAKRGVTAWAPSEPWAAAAPPANRPVRSPRPPRQAPAPANPAERLRATPARPGPR